MAALAGKQSPVRRLCGRCSSLSLTGLIAYLFLNVDLPVCFALRSQQSRQRLFRSSCLLDRESELWISRRRVQPKLARFGKPPNFKRTCPVTN